MRITKKRVKELMTLHNLYNNDLIGGSTIPNEDFQAWLNGYNVLTEHQEQEIFNRALKIDLEERKAIKEETKEIGFPLSKLKEDVDISRGWFGMWINGKRNIPYEKEKKIYDNFDHISEAFGKVNNPKN